MPGKLGYGQRFGGFAQAASAPSDLTSVIARWARDPHAGMFSMIDPTLAAPIRGGVGLRLTKEQDR